MIQKLFRRIIRAFLCRTNSTYINSLAMRVPFSRYHAFVPWLLKGKEVIEWRELKIEVDPGLTQDYFTYFFGDYAPGEIEKLVEVCKDARIFVDVGAHSGLVSLAVAQACPDITVFSFEPDHHALQKIHTNIRHNSHLAHRIFVVEKAVSDAEGTSLFISGKASKNPETGRLVYTGSQDYRQGCQVSTVRLDTFFQSSDCPDVIKIDVEGFEIHVLHSLAGMVSANLPKAIMVETHGLYFGDQAREFNEQVVSVLKSFGGTIYVLHNRTWLPLKQSLGAAARTHLLILRDYAVE